MFKYKKKKNLLALIANMFSHSNSFDFSIALMTQSFILITNKSSISQFFVAMFTCETMWMPISSHCLNYTTDNKFPAFITAWSKEYMKISFAIFSFFKFIKNTILKWTKALSTTKN